MKRYSTKYAKILSSGLLIIVLGFLSLTSYAQNDIDYYVEPKDSTKEQPEEFMPADAVEYLSDHRQLPNSVGISQADSLYQSTLGQVNDSLTQITSYIGAMEDSLQSLQILQDIDQKRAALLDTLATLQLPAELTNYIDSLRSIPASINNIQSKLDINKYQSADTLVTRYIDNARNFISDQQQKIEEKGSSLLPEKFYNKLDKLKSKTGVADADALNMADKLTSKYELDYKKYLSIDRLKEYLNTDMDFLNDMDGYLGQLDSYTGKFDEYMGEVNTYLGKSDVQGLTDLDVNNLDLPGNMQLDGIAELEGLNTEEAEKLISEYGALDAETLDQRIDQMASEYAEINELQSQAGDLEGMQSEQLGEFEQLKSFAGTNFDEKMALKKGQVIANEQLMENSEIIQTAMKEVDAFKKKYAIVTNSNFKEEEEGEKPTKHVELQKRFFYGGDIQLIPGDPFEVDFSGLIGYKIANKTSVGIAASVGYVFEESENYLPDFDSEPEYGGRAFVQYSVFKAFFLQGEVEAANVYNDSESKIWEINYLAGIGRSMTIKDKIKLNVTFLYHINNKDSYAHEQPYVIRIGFSSK